MKQKIQNQKIKYNDTRSNDPRLSTSLILMAEFKSGIISLEIVAERFLGISGRVAQEKFNKGELPFPAARLSNSQKSPVFVRVDDLAVYIDEIFDKANHDWSKSKV